MTLKLIPTEELGNSHAGAKPKKQKTFNPGAQLNKEGKTKHGVLKTICLRLVHFINRGSHFTYQQIDDLIVTLHQSIVELQKKKREILDKKHQRLKNKL